jgi:cysteinyl-tRNA synthetase
MASLKGLLRSGGTGRDLPDELIGISDRFSEAMDDDFNTPRCLAILFDAARAINRMSSDSGSLPESTPSRELLSEVDAVIVRLSRDILGLLQEDPETFLETLRRSAAKHLKIGEDMIRDLIVQRASARKQKDFQRADQIRNDLASQGILLEDGPSGTTWKVKNSH